MGPNETLKLLLSKGRHNQFVYFCFYFHYSGRQIEKDIVVIAFVKNFFYIYGDDNMVFILQIFNMVYHPDWFVVIEKSFHPWGKSHLIMVYHPFMYYWIQITSVLLRIFASMFISNIDLFFSVCVTSLSVFLYQGDGGLIEWTWECPSFAVFWNWFRMIGVSSSLNVW